MRKLRVGICGYGSLGRVHVGSIMKINGNRSTRTAMLTVDDFPCTRCPEPVGGEVES